MKVNLTAKHLSVLKLELKENVEANKIHDTKQAWDYSDDNKYKPASRIL